MFREDVDFHLAAKAGIVLTEFEYIVPGLNCSRGIPRRINRSYPVPYLSSV